MRKSEQDDLQDLIAPALKGLTRSGAAILLITVIPGGFLLHLSSGLVISLAHGYVPNRDGVSILVKIPPRPVCEQVAGAKKYN